MRILQVSLEYPPYSFGGVGSHVFHLSRVLAESGVEVAVLSAGLVEGEKKDGNIRHFAIPIARSPGSKLVSFALKVPGAVKRIRSLFPFDVVHSHFGSCAFLGNEIISPARLVETAHGTHIGELSALKPMRRLLPKEVLGKYSVYPFLAFLDLQCYRKAARIIAVSELARQEISRYGRRFLDKTVIIPNGIQLSEFPLDVSAEIATGSEIRCLTVAFMQARKGLDYLLEAVSLLDAKNVRFTIVGDGPHFARLVRLAVQLGIADRVTFTGRLDRDEVRREFGNSQLFVLPSLWEGQGIVFLEAMASGLPIIATRIPGVRGMLEHGVNAVLVPPADSRALAGSIQELVQNPQLRMRLASEGVSRVKKYNWNELVEQIFSLYSSLLKGE